MATKRISQRRGVLLLAGILVLQAQVTHAQWVPMNGPSGGFAEIVVSGSNLFARTRGIYRSTDDGLTWVAVNNGLTTLSINGLAASGSTLIATGSEGQVFRSNDAGTSWQQVGQFDAWNVSALIAIGSAGFFAANQAGVYRSTDGGATWNNTGFPSVDVTCFAFTVTLSGVYLYAATWYNGVYRTTNLGSSWQLMNSTGLTDQAINDLIIAGSHLFAATRSGGVFQSSSLSTAATWSAVNTGLMDTTVSDLELNAINGTSIFAATPNNGIYRANTSTLTWSPVNTGMPFKKVNALGRSSIALFAGTPGGTYRSSDTGSTWNLVGAGLPAPAITALSISPSNPTLLYATAAYGGVHRSTNRGATWTPVPSGLGHLDAWDVEFIPGPTEKIYTATLGGGVCLSTDNGTSWTPINTGLTNLSVRSLLFSGNKLFAGTQNFIYVSTNEGASWTRVTPYPGLYVRSFTHMGSIIFAGTHQGPVYRSTDNGTTWTAVNNGLTFFAKYSLLATPNASGGMIVFVGGSGGQVYASVDSGGTWAPSHSGLPLATTIYSLVATGSNIFAGTLDYGVFLSSDYGANWGPVNAGLPDPDVYSLVIDPGPPARLLAGTGSYGVWSRPLAEMITSSGSVPNELPDKFSLLQNYPNPFNPATTITYQLPASVFVTLKVFDIVGREVATLVSDFQQPGSYTVEWNAGEIASGVYFYRMQAGSFVATRKLMVLR